MTKTFRVTHDGDRASFTFESLALALDWIRAARDGEWITLTTSEGKRARFVNGRLFGEVQHTA